LQGRVRNRGLNGLAPVLREGTDEVDAAAARAGNLAAGLHQRRWDLK
jgi:hypothetical protein